VAPLRVVDLMSVVTIKHVTTPPPMTVWEVFCAGKDWVFAGLCVIIKPNMTA